MTKHKMTDIQRAVLKRIKRHGHLVASFDDDGEVYVTSQGVRLQPRTIEVLVREGYLVPSKDALFNGTSQTYYPA